MSSCCYQCPNRTVKCHDECESYRKFREENEKRKRDEFINRDWRHFNTDGKTTRIIRMAMKHENER